MEKTKNGSSILTTVKRTDSSFNLEFKKISTEIAEIAKSVNIKIYPYHDPKLIYFSKLELAQRKLILQQLEIYLQICKKIVAELGTNFDFGQSIWIALKEFGFTPSSDLFQYLKNDRIIEIHNLDGQQVYRNLYFFKFCSYTLEELYSIPWVELFSRPEKNIHQMVSFVQKMSSTKIHKTVKVTEIEPHELVEIRSALKIKSFYEPLYYSPLFDKYGNVTAGLAIENAQVISMNTELNSELIHFNDITKEESQNVIPLFKQPVIDA